MARAGSTIARLLTAPARSWAVFELVGAHDHQPAAGGGHGDVEPLLELCLGLRAGRSLELGLRRGQLVGHPEVGGELGHQRVQIERDLPAPGRHERTAAVDDPEQLLVRRSVGRHPGVLHPGAGEQLGRGAIGELPEAGRGWAGEPLQVRRQALLDRSRHVGVGEQLVDQVRAERGLDPLLGQQL
jgi:hypothetical protein